MSDAALASGAVERSQDATMPLSRRLAFGFAVAFAAALYAGFKAYIHPDWTTDFDQFWYACQAMFEGRDPYSVVGPGKEFDWGYALFYPMPGLLVASPFALLALPAARVLFSTVGGFVVGYAIAPQWERRWPLLLSMAFFSAITRNQWSPFVLAAAWVPLAGAIVAIKPNTGLITLAVQDRRALTVSIGTAIALVVLSFVVRPDWLGTWLQLLRHAPNKEFSVLQPMGFLLVASLVAWRSIEGRTMAAMSVIPHTPSLYDLLPIFITTVTASEALVVAACTHLLHWWVIALGPYVDRDAAYLALARWEVAIIFLPALALLLRREWIRRGGGAEGRDGLTLPAVVRHALAIACAISLGVQIWMIRA